ncbi:MAG: RNA polymerase factor sigma-54 [Ignavibacteria bacterium]|nr:RNA polymerase factor sigma-54 [Ignavibacteria bacterium]
MLNLSQKLAQQLKMLPQQIQYQKLLQLNNLSLELRIKNELDINPLLEEIPIEEISLDQTREEESDSGEESFEFDSNDEYTFEDFLNDNLDGYKSTSQTDTEEQADIPAPDRPSLKEHLISQLRLLNLDEDQYRLGEEIIGYIDEDGYLTSDLHDIVKDLELFDHIKISHETAERILRQIQHFDPIGIGSRTLQECLLIQMEEKELHDDLKNLVIKILKDAYEDFTQKRYEALQEKFKITREELKDALNIIQHLNPKPGEGDSLLASLNQITPDLIVEKVEGRFVVFLNERNLPQLRINNSYEAYLSQRGKRAKNKSEKDVKKFLREKLDSAKWFIESINQRKITMLRIMNMIVEKQHDFFELGEKHLKPMIYKDVAEPLQLDISTISRVVNGKYVQSSVGIHELKYFFSEGLETDSGEEISNKNVKIRIEEIISSEDKEKPFTDEELGEILNKEGIKIARRTVAKYREQLGLPVAKLRREL